MNEKPIIFCSEMVRSILKGHKTQTRRVVKPQPHDMPVGAYIDPYNKNYAHFTAWTADHRMCLGCGGSIRGAAHWQPSYQPGDILWVRESFCPNYFDDGSPAYKTDYDKQRIGDVVSEPKWKPSIHMPRTAARIFLRVTDVRVERVHEISEADAKAEGIRSYFLHKEHGGDWHESNSSFTGVDYNTHATRQKAFAELWDSLNAKRGYGWDVNPWVWVISFERLIPGLKTGHQEAAQNGLQFAT